MNNKVKIGLDMVEKTDFYLDFDKTPAFLIGGATGTGKTVLLNSILINLLNQNDSAEFILIDPKATAFAKYSDFNNVKRFTYKEIKELSDSLNDLCMSIDSINHDVFIFIDDLNSLFFEKSYLSADQLVKLIDESNTSNKIHLLIASQVWWQKTKTIKSKLKNIICFDVSSEADSVLIMGMPGCEKLNNHGLCFIKIDDELSLVYCDKPDIELRGIMRGKILAKREQ